MTRLVVFVGVLFAETMICWLLVRAANLLLIRVYSVHIGCVHVFHYLGRVMI